MKEETNKYINEINKNGSMSYVEGGDVCMFEERYFANIRDAVEFGKEIMRQHCINAVQMHKIYTTGYVEPRAQYDLDSRNTTIDTIIKSLAVSE